VQGGVNSDGHTGTENKKVNEGGSGPIQLVLAALTRGSGDVHFVVHATSASTYSFGLQPTEFLDRAGLARYDGNCIFLGDRCFFRRIAELKPLAFQREYLSRFSEVQAIHAAFKELTGKMGRLFELDQERDRILQLMRSATRPTPIFGEPIRLSLATDDAPEWIRTVQFRQLSELEDQRSALDTRIQELRQFLPLLYASGEPLEVAVMAALEFLGLRLERTPPGFTADLLALTDDGTRSFGFEVTGIGGPVKKDSPKLTQVIDFERIKEYNERTVLIANTFNSLPIEDRQDRESFTPQVVDFLGRHEVLLMTTWDLYRIVRDILDGLRSGEEMLDLLTNAQGVFAFDSLPQQSSNGKGA
jgi:hypothetical protein